jgi:hypothetical protein
VLIAYISVRNVFPYFDARLPLGFAIFVTYVLGAYVLIPAFIRLFRIVHPADHLPLYCVTPDGFASDPLNIGIIGTRRELIMAMEKAGWHLADPHIPKNMLRMGLSVLLERPYLHAPVSSLYLFGRKQDIAFEKQVEGADTTARHHVRFWATTYERKKKLTVHAIHWHHRKTHIFGDSLLWIGAASLDVGVSLVRHNLQLTHMIDPDTNKERDLIVQELKAENLVSRTEQVRLGDPYQLVNRVWRGYMHTDGMMTTVRLRK